MRALLAKPAAQHQGEPFRWFYAGVAYTSKPHSDAIPLYLHPAEQPEPVARGEVESFELWWTSLASHWESSDAKVAAWQAWCARNENVTRLQAEVDRLKVACGKEFESVQELDLKCSALQSELTQLREALYRAENPPFTGRLDTWQAACGKARGETEALRSDLTKALSWLRHAKPLLHSGGYNLAADDIGGFLASQSAPAAKESE